MRPLFKPPSKNLQSLCHPFYMPRSKSLFHLFYAIPQNFSNFYATLFYATPDFFYATTVYATPNFEMFMPPFFMPPWIFFYFKEKFEIQESISTILIYLSYSPLLFYATSFYATPQKLKSLCHPLFMPPSKFLCHPVYATPGVA